MDATGKLLNIDPPSRRQDTTENATPTHPTSPSAPQSSTPEAPEERVLADRWRRLLAIAMTTDVVIADGPEAAAGRKHSGIHNDGPVESC